MRGKSHGSIGLLAAIQTSLLFKLPISIASIAVATFFSLLPDLDQPNSVISKIIVKNDISKYIYKIFIYLINVFIFFVSIKINENFYMSAIITFVVIIIVESKITHLFLRRILLSFMFMLLTLALHLVSAPIYFIGFSGLLAVFPWLKHRSLSHSVFAVILIYFALKQIELVSGFKCLAIYGSIGYASHIFLGDIFTKQGVPLFYPISEKKISFGFLKVGSRFGNIAEYLFIACLLALVIATFFWI